MTEFGPLNSEPVFKAFIKSCQDAGDTVYTNRNDDCDVAVFGLCFGWVECRTTDLFGTDIRNKTSRWL